MLKNTLVLLFACTLIASCVTRKTTMPVIVAPEHHSHTERTETIAPDGSYTVKKETRVVH